MKCLLIFTFLIPTLCSGTSYDSGGSGVVVGYTNSANAAGTAYSLTNTPAALDFGTTDPSITIAQPGTYLIVGSVNVKYNGSTFAASRTVTLKWRRTNNTAADIGTSSVISTDIITALTYTMGIFPLSPVIYTTSNSNDIVTIFGDVSVVPTAGSLDCNGAEIYVVRLK